MNFFNQNANLFYPLTLSMPVHCILFGISSLGQKWREALPHHTDLWCEPTVLPDTELIKASASLQEGEALTDGRRIIALRPFKTQKEWSSDRLLNSVSDYQTISYGDVSDKQIRSISDLLSKNKERLSYEIISLLERGALTPHKDFSATFVHPEAQVSPCYIDDAQGPVYIGAGVKILPGAKIMGPVAFLEGAVVKMGSELYPGSTFGAFTTLNGEMKNVILHEFSAKGHAGYVGDSILGRWNNLGAGTTVSNLRHTFSNIRMAPWGETEKQDIGSMKRGLVTGDMVRLGIESRISNATAIGSFSSLATGELIQGNIPEFSWWTGSKKSLYRPEKAKIHARRQMALRKKTWDDTWEASFENLSKRRLSSLNTNL